MKKSSIYLIITALLFLGCDKKVYNSEECNKLSMAAFKGLPNESREFKKNCKGIKIKYTRKVCEEALQNLILGSNEEQLTKLYGSKIMSCFTNNDIKKFGPKSED